MTEPVQANSETQTKAETILLDERTRDVIAALLAALYLLLALAFFAWQLFDVWSEQYYFIQRMLIRGVLGLDKSHEVPADRLASGVFRTAAFAVTGGGMGGAVNGIRSMLQRHTDPDNPKEFRWRFAYVYAFLPPLGATLGLIVVAITRTGLGVLSGTAEVEAGTGPAMSSLAIGFLAGYGSGVVFVWLDSRVTELFRPSNTPVPSLIGETIDQAQKTLNKASLNLGTVSFVDGAIAADGRISAQEPRAFRRVSESSTVDVTVKPPPAKPVVGNPPADPQPPLLPGAPVVADGAAAANPPAANRVAEDAAGSNPPN